MTEDIKVSALASKLSDTGLTFTNPSSGPEVIETYLDEFIAAIELLKIITSERDNYDAFIIACGDDPGYSGAREITDKPVVPIGLAPMLIAPLLGRKFSILGHWQGDVPRSIDKVAKYGMSGYLASVLSTGNALETQRDHDGKLDLMENFGKRAIEKDGAEVLIFTGAAFAGMHKELSRRLKVPVLEGISCAVRLCEMLIDLELHTTRVGQYLPLSKPKKLVGFSEFLSLENFIADNSEFID